MMKKTCENEDYRASIPEDKKDLVRSTQNTLVEWKNKSKRKRFRSQNIQGMIFALTTFKLLNHFLISLRLIINRW